jgi:8-oxo-dGTP pyrophosphatase MutT (NUDIX family)
VTFLLNRSVSFFGQLNLFNASECTMSEMPFRLEPKVAQWERLVQEGGCTLNGVTPLSLLRKHNGELLFALCEADAADSEGRKLPGYIFIRGNAVIVAPLLVNLDTGEEKFLMIRQRRIGNGSLNLEFPAGMLDRNVDAPRDVAVRELLEETGLSLPPVRLAMLSSAPLFSSPGASDEAIYYFGCVVSLSAQEYSAFEGHRAGNGDEGESITVTLRTRKEARRETVSLQARLGLYLFDEWQAGVQGNGARV